jgi:hypothetical protein
LICFVDSKDHSAGLQLNLLAFNHVSIRMKPACVYSNVIETQLKYLDKPLNLDLKVPKNQLGQLQPTVNIANLVETSLELPL